MSGSRPGGGDLAAVQSLLANVLDALDWRALGDVYFHDDGERLWRERLERVQELGLVLAARCLALAPTGGRSLWVGAGVAELPVLLAETIVAGREVVAANLRTHECTLLNAGLEQTGAALRYTPADAVAAAGDRRFDLIGCISVFTDPERWPMLSGVAYGRLPPVQLDVERFVAERDEARQLAAGLFRTLTTPGVVATTPEEVAWFLEQADAAGLPVEASDDLLETAVVGDPVGFLRIG